MKRLGSFAVSGGQLICGVLVLAGCHGNPLPTETSGGIGFAHTRDQLIAHVDAPVAIVGKALREKDYKDQRPNIQIADGTRVEIGQLKVWPNGLRGRRVTATGIARRRTPPRSPPGFNYQSRAPEWFVIEQADVELAR